MRRFANRQRVGKWQRRHSTSGCYWQFLRRPLKFACRFASIVITVANSEENLKEAAVIETSRIAKVRSVSASLWIAPSGSRRSGIGCCTGSGSSSQRLAAFEEVQVLEVHGGEGLGERPEHAERADHGRRALSLYV